jgi:hypothetical protein
MQDLTGRFAAPLCPSSMSAGNTVKNERTAGIEMTAPGSESILPASPTRDQVIEIPAASDEKIPVSFPGTHDKVTVMPGGKGGGSWDDAHTIPSPSRWRETT